MKREKPEREDRSAGRKGVTVFGVTLAASFFVGAGCSSETPGEARVRQERAFALSGELMVDPSEVHQHITGFGASSAWTAQSLSEQTADLLFSPDLGIGLSLLRLRIAPDGSTGELATAESAHARGAAVWAAPWSPPGAWKTSGTDNYGGKLLPEYYQAWAERLSGFAGTLSAAGVPLLALSAQNEPNWVAEWETCEYSPEELTTFVRDHLGPALERDSPGTRLLAPETIDWLSIAGYAEPLLADPDANALIGIVAVHAYGGVPFAYAAPGAHGKEFWETEVSYDEYTGVTATLVTAREIHRHLTTAGVNAFHYWWLLSESGGGLVSGDELTPQAYGLAHYSKFIRPGFVRVEMPAEPHTGIYASAYSDPASGRTVIVAVNETTTLRDATFRIAGLPEARAEPWLTTAEVELAAQTPIVFEDALSYGLPAESVTTLVVSALVEPPANGSGGEGGAPAEAGGTAGAGGAAGGAGEAGGSENGGPPEEPSRAGRAGRGSGNDDGGEAGSGESAEPNSPAAERLPRARYVACSLGNGARSASAATPYWASVLLFAYRRRRRARR